MTNFQLIRDYTIDNLSHLLMTLHFSWYFDTSYLYLELSKRKWAQSSCYNFIVVNDLHCLGFYLVPHGAWDSGRPFFIVNSVCFVLSQMLYKPLYSETTITSFSPWLLKMILLPILFSANEQTIKYQASLLSVVPDSAQELNLSSITSSLDHFAAIRNWQCQQCTLWLDFLLQESYYQSNWYHNRHF